MSNKNGSRLLISVRHLIHFAKHFTCVIQAMTLPDRLYYSILQMGNWCKGGYMIFVPAHRETVHGIAQSFDPILKHNEMLSFEYNLILGTYLLMPWMGQGTILNFLSQVKTMGAGTYHVAWAIFWQWKVAHYFQWTIVVGRVTVPVAILASGARIAYVSVIEHNDRNIYICAIIMFVLLTYTLWI